MASASTLRTFRIGGQVDPAWATATLPWTSVRAVATLSSPTDGSLVVDPTNGATEAPLTVSNTLTATQAAGQWCTAALKPTTAAAPSQALQPTGLYWVVVVAVQRGASWQTVGTWRVQLDGVRDYVTLGETITVAGQVCVNVNALPAATGPTATGTGLTVWAWDGARWTIDPNVAIYLQRTGDPTPTGLAAGDIVIKQN